MKHLFNDDIGKLTKAYLDAFNGDKNDQCTLNVFITRTEVRKLDVIVFIKMNFEDQLLPINNFGLRLKSDIPQDEAVDKAVFGSLIESINILGRLCTIPINIGKLLYPGDRTHFKECVLNYPMAKAFIDYEPLMFQLADLYSKEKYKKKN